MNRDRAAKETTYPRGKREKKDRTVPGETEKKMKRKGNVPGWETDERGLRIGRRRVPYNKS